MLFWALLVSGQITMRRVDGWQTLAEKLSDQIVSTKSLTSPHDRIDSCRPKTRQQIPTQLATERGQHRVPGSVQREHVK